jgi:hypothetical protein
MQIEFPEFPPVALAAEIGPATIGDFYDTIATAFTQISPTIDPSANAVNVPGAPAIRSIDDAQAIIARIKQEGEGTEGSPSQPPNDSLQFAHYYAFKQILVGKMLVYANGEWSFSGADVYFPGVNSFTQSWADPDPSAAFNQALTQLLKDLQACWTSGAAANITDMLRLRKLGIGLIQQGIRPEFLWAE